MKRKNETVHVKIMKLMLLCLCLLTFCDCFNIDVRESTARLIFPHLPGSSQKNNQFATTQFGYRIKFRRGENATNLKIGSPKSFLEDRKNGFASGNIVRHYNVSEVFETNGTANYSFTPSAPERYPGDNFGIFYDVGKNGSMVACSCTRIEQQCTSVQYNPGFCYQRHGNNATWAAVPRGNKTADCSPPLLDLIFLLDGSSSVGAANFETVKQFVIDVTKTLYKKEVKNYFGVIQYSYAFRNRPINEQPLLETEVALGEISDISEYENSVKSIELHGHSTYTAAGIRKSIHDFKTSSRFTNLAVSKILILVTDGKASDPDELDEAAADARSLNISTFAVGIGDSIDPKELRIIATGNETSKEHVFRTDFSSLQSIVTVLQKDIQFSLEGASSSSNTEFTFGLEKAEMGFSITYGLNEGAFYLGAVGAFDWSGTIVKYDSEYDEEPDIPDFTEVQRVLKNWTKESYLGYSIAIGSFDGNSSEEFVAIGAPRYKLKGAVVIFRPLPGSATFSNARTIYPNANNSQLGSYFGGSLLSVDLNNDGRDDLLVGAPLYIDGSYDDGRVYVYIAPPSGLTHELWSNDPPGNYFKILSGGTSSQGGRFGTSMATAGDLNADGYNDVIIGAPYADDHCGAVFVFHGSEGGIDTVVKQVIRASDFLNYKLLHFGMSLEGREDLDNNGYPDIAIGAPESDKVVILRACPVAVFNVSLQFHWQEPNVFDCFETSERACLLLTSCFRVTGKTVEPIINIDFRLDLDSGVVGFDNKRVEFKKGLSRRATGIIGGNMNLAKGVQHCFNNTVYVKRIVSDFSAPIEAILTYNLSESHRSKPMASIRDPSVSNQKKATTSFSKNCGDDDICNDDLAIDANMQLPSVNLGGKDISEGRTILVVSRETALIPIVVKVNLSNNGENAFNVKVLVNYTTQLSWSGLHHTRSSNVRSSLPCIDDSQRDTSDTTSRVKVLNYRYSQNQGNILFEKNWCYFEFHLSSNSLSSNGSLPDIRIAVLAKTGVGTDVEEDTNKEYKAAWNASAPVLYRADESVQNKSPETKIPFNFTETETTIRSVKEIGVNTSDIKMTYEVKGGGHSNIPSSTISLSFPNRLPRTNNADMMHLLYLSTFSCESTVGKATCVCDDSVVNPYHLLQGFPSENDSESHNITLKHTPYPINKSTMFDCFEDQNNFYGSDGICNTLRCTVTDLAPTDVIVLTASFRLWTHSLNITDVKVTLRSLFRFSTENSSRIINIDGKEIELIAMTNTIAQPYKPPDVIKTPDPSEQIFWAIVGSAIALGVLLVIVVIMHKTGFFKSKYADMKEELEWRDVPSNTVPSNDFVFTGVPGNSIGITDVPDIGFPGKE